MPLSWLVATLLIPPLSLIGLAIYVWRRRTSQSGLEVVALFAVVALWGLTSAFEKLVVDLDAKIWIAKLQYLGIVGVGPCCVAVALSARAWPADRVWRWLRVLAVPSATSLALVLTNDWHNSFWRAAYVDASAGFPVLRFDYGPGFWFHTMWSYALLATALGLMVAKWMRSWRHYRGEAACVLIGTAVPIVANLAYLTQAGSAANLDLTPAAFSVTAFSLGWSLLFRDGLFDVVHLAKREILDHMADGALVIDLRDRLVYLNLAARQVLGLETLRVPCRLADALGPYPELLELGSSDSDATRECEIPVDGRARKFDLALTPLHDPAGRLASRLVVLRDMTLRERAADRIRASEDALRKVVDLVPHLIYAKDEHGRFLLVNQAAADSFGRTPEDLVGCDLAELGLLQDDTHRIHGSDLAVIESGQRRSVDESISGPGGTSITYQTTKIPFVFPATGARALLGISIDVTERLRDEERIRQLAFFDSLTGLPNRRRFLNRLTRALETARRRKQRLAVLFLDLDDFKDVNDRLGHAAGDELLRGVSKRLQDAIRFSDHIAFASLDEPGEAVSRLAGDEFTILLTDIRDSTDGGLVAHRILEDMSRPFEIGGERVRIRMSIGMSSFPEDGDDVDTLMSCADHAMYEAKRTRHGFAFYDPSTRARAERRNQLDAELRGALAADEMRMRIQPMRNAMTGEVTGAEALIRWHNAVLGEVEPSEFVPIAEESGMIVEIGDWLLRRVCESIGRWKQAGLSVPCISINVSGVQLRERSFAATFARILRESHVGADEIELELTEGMTLDLDEITAQTLADLRDIGARLSLNDFGAGRSSIRNLRGFEFSRMKIDRCFVRELPHSRDDEVLASGIVAMARGLGLSVVAVGVENEAQVECLRNMGCDELQGFLLSQPLPPDEFESYLQREKDAD